MSNYIWKTGHKEIANITSLTPDAYNVTHMSERASWAVESFLQTAWLLPGNGFLGWQMNSDKTGLRAFAFSKGDVKMTSGDFGWIFEEYADVEAQAPTNSGHSGAGICPLRTRIISRMWSGL